MMLSVSRDTVYRYLSEGGRSIEPAEPQPVLNADQVALARRMKANGETAATICSVLGIGRTALYRYLAEGGED